MKIYTRTGDTGTTQIIGGKRVSKHTIRVESYGTVDELNSYLGLILAKFSEEDQDLKDEIFLIQQLLFELGTDLAVSAETKLPAQLSNKAVSWLEKKIDQHSETLPMTTSFILPRGHETAGMLQVARTIARRAERLIVNLHDTEPVNPEVLKFINRLSDYLFVAARWVNRQKNLKEDCYDKAGLNKLLTE